MANKMSQAPIAGNMHLLQHQQQKRKMQHGGPKKQKLPVSSITKVANGTSDVVSDESEDAGNDGDSSSLEDDDDDNDDEPDVMALSGSARRRIKAIASPLLAGLSRKISDASEEDFAMAGAELDLNNESDDATYQAAAIVSDDDSDVDDEDVVLASAEKDLIAEFEFERPDTANGVMNEMIEMTITEELAPVSHSDLPSDGSQEAFVDLDWHADPFGGLNASDGIYQAMRWDAEVEYLDQLAGWRTEREASVPLATQKKVRFEDTASSRASSMSSEEDPRDLFPDLFDDVNVMAAQHSIAISDAGAELATDNESVFDYDFEDEHTKAEFEDDDDSESDSDASDSETDFGDSTDEETPAEQLLRVQQLKAAKKGLVPALGPLPVVPRTPAASKKNSPNMSRSNCLSTSSKVITPKTAGKPRTGTFAHDPTRASITAGASRSGVKLVCPTKPPAEDREYWERARQAMSSRDGSPGNSVSWYRATPRTPSIPQRPLTAKSTLGTMFDGNLDFLHSNDEHGIAKELLRSSRKNSMQSSFTSNSLTDAEVTDESSNVNMADFVQMDESDSDMEEDNMTASQQDFFNESMVQSSPMRDRPAGLLDHFDQQRGLVSSFRNNQHIARHVSSLPANPARRAQLSEANALQQGRRAAANTPMTPARKKRQDLDNTGAGIKKTASPLVQKHRRSRGSSLSGIQLDRLAGNVQ